MSDLPPMPEVADSVAGYKASFVRDFAREYARQAILAEREANAIKCDAIADRDGDDDEWHAGRVAGAEECAAAIRRGSV